MWTVDQVAQYKKAAAALDRIMQKTFEFVLANRKNVTEWAVQTFILKQFDKNKIRRSRNHPNPMVAFGENTSDFHHCASRKKRKKLQTGDVIFVDMWGALKNRRAPLADITWAGFCGKKIPQRVQHVFATVFKARDASIRFIRRELKKGRLPIGSAIDGVARKVVEKAGFSEDHFPHSLGHVLGTTSPHGIGVNLDWEDDDALKPGYGYTIEPGIYIEGEFGVRSEIDFFITPDLELQVTSRVQRKIVQIS